MLVWPGLLQSRQNKDAIPRLSCLTWRQIIPSIVSSVLGEDHLFVAHPVYPLGQQNPFENLEMQLLDNILQPTSHIRSTSFKIGIFFFCETPDIHFMVNFADLHI